MVFLLFGSVSAGFGSDLGPNNEFNCQGPLGPSSVAASSSSFPERNMASRDTMQTQRV